MIHIQHVLSLFHVMTFWVNSDPAFSVNQLQVIRFLALHSNGFQKPTHPLHGGSLLIQTALIICTCCTCILLDVERLCVILLWHVLMTRKLSLRGLLLVLGLMLWCPSILVKLIDMLI